MEEKNDETKRLISRISSAISWHENSHREIGYYEADGYANELDQTREDIMFLSNNFPDEARKLMQDLIEIQDSVFERSDDSNGSIGEAFKRCVEDLGKIFSKLSVDISDVVEVVYDLFIYNDYGVTDDVISNFKDALKEEGLNLLKEEFMKSISSKKNGYYNDTIKRGLREIADCRNDVDEYIQACSFATEIHQHDHLDIARRLIDHGRYDEALEWLNKMEHPITPSWRENYSRLKIDALMHLGKCEEAQQERIAWFNCGLNHDLYEEILKYADDDFKNKFREQTIERVFAYYNIWTAMDFLIKLGETNKCAQLVFLKEETMDCGNSYTVGLIRPFAAALRKTEPLASTILYRKLLEYVLNRVASKYYQYAAEDLIACYELSSQITDFGERKNHDEYFREIQEKHKKKRTFWSTFNPLIERKLRLK
ncbi:hypothetical protein FACS189472_04180 [Alphaproteobacteria bacterium]|nr:hypothetical protein FACS189472_04180 [Alphaproteobacteria bacterium]